MHGSVRGRILKTCKVNHSGRGKRVEAGLPVAPSPSDTTRAEYRLSDGSRHERIDNVGTGEESISRTSPLERREGSEDDSVEDGDAAVSKRHEQGSGSYMRHRAGAGNDSIADDVETQANCVCGRPRRDIGDTGEEGLADGRDDLFGQVDSSKGRVLAKGGCGDLKEHKSVSCGSNTWYRKMLRNISRIMVRADSQVDKRRSYWSREKGRRRRFQDSAR